MSRKTISVEKIKNKANNLLANPDIQMEQKLGVIIMIEGILSETDNYNGFRSKSKFILHSLYTQPVFYQRCKRLKTSEGERLSVVPLSEIAVYDARTS